MNLMFLRGYNRSSIDKTRKKSIKGFKKLGFDMEIKTSLKGVDFSDVTFDLIEGVYRRYTKKVIL